MIIFSGDQDEDEEERKLWTELSSERVLRAVEAALTALHILTAPNMPKRACLLYRPFRPTDPSVDHFHADGVC